MRVEGEVARDLSAVGERIELAGEVGRDLEVWAENVVVLPAAHVGGHLRAHLPEAERLEVAEDAQVEGDTDVEVLDPHGHTMWSRYRDGRFYTWLAVSFVASFLIGLLLHCARAELARAPHRDGARFFRALGLGVAFAVLAPLALLLLRSRWWEFLWR